MGWGNCGEDSKGSPIGYVFPAVCDFPGCEEKIHRGLDFACGKMHGEDTYSCEKYFCYTHLIIVEIGNEVFSLCPDCVQACIDDEETRIDL